MKRSSWTLKQDNQCFKCWNIFKLFVCFITTMMYPYYSVNGFPVLWSTQFIFLVFLELVFGFEIILKFFLQELDEKGQSLYFPLEIVATNYLRSEFLIDLFVLLPLGGIFSEIDDRWKILWLIKAYRLK